MRRLVLILIGISAPLVVWAYPTEGWDCPREEVLVVTAPRAGARTFRDFVTVKGFLCEKSYIVEVKNVTTRQLVMTDTDEVCEASHCVYTFSTSVRGLALGRNELTATVPGHDPPVEVRFEVIRTALAGL
jgi:hypothetical protein